MWIDFYGNEAKKKKNQNQNGQLNKTVFSKLPFLRIFSPKFHRLVLELVELMLLNPYGREAVRNKL